MKKSRKTLALILALIMCMSLLGACGGNSATNTDTSGTETTTANTPAS